MAHEKLKGERFDRSMFAIQESGSGGVHQSFLANRVPLSVSGGAWGHCPGEIISKASDT